MTPIQWGKTLCLSMLLLAGCGSPSPVSPDPVTLPPVVEAPSPSPIVIPPPPAPPPNPGSPAPGSLDTTFGAGGKVVTPIGVGTSTDLGRAMVIQPDGKLVVAGYAGMGTTGTDIALARYNPDGTLDPSFGTGGKITTAVGPGVATDIAYALQIQSDGKLVAAGFTVMGTTGQDIALVRYNADGTLDTSFGTGGKVTTAVAPTTAPDVAYALQVQRDGKLVVAGYANISPTGNDFALVRYNSNGTLDSSFGAGGKVMTAIGPSTSPDVAFALQLQPDGKLVAAGYTNLSTTGNDIALTRYNTDGSLDTAFGIGGAVTTAIGPSTNADVANSVQVQADGKLVVAGSADTGGAARQDFALVRYSATGTLDPSFGAAGKVTTNIASTDIAYALQVQPDGKLVVAGAAGTDTTGTDIALTRYNANGTLDSSFGTSGVVTTQLGSSSNWHIAYALQAQADGKLVVAGYADMGTSIDFALVRFNP